MEIFVGWLLFSAVVGVIAASWGRSGFSWFLMAMLLSPLLMVIVLLAKGKPGPERDEFKRCPSCKKVVSETAVICSACNFDFSRPVELEKVCPRCAETIKKAAKVCRFCSAELTATSNGDSTEQMSGEPLSIYSASGKIQVK